MSDDHLDDAAYMRSVVDTITHSLRDDSSISIHDLLDAYVTFTNRVRSQSPRLEASHVLPALAPLNTHKDNFIRALRRDIRLAHTDPLSSYLGSSIHSGIKKDAKQYAINCSSLCHHALCALTAIFRFPAFHSIFFEYDLSMLFGDVLDIALADRLPLLGRSKTYSLSLWALSSHCLPVAVLSSRRDDVFYALHRCLSDVTQPADAVLDGLKVTSHTMEHYPSEFLDVLYPLLPHVIANLRSESSGLRLHACIALGKFANALVRQADVSPTRWETLSNHIIPFLESCCDESNFTYIIRAAFCDGPHACHRDAPTWVHAVLSSWIILCGPTLYGKPVILRFILQTLAMTLTNKRSIIRVLHPHVWRCFVWTFSQMLLRPENVPSLISSAFHVLKQEVRGGIGIALVNVLLSDRAFEEHDNRLLRALSIISAMVRAECKHTRQEGFVLLQALTKEAQADHQVLRNTYEIPASVLFDEALIGADWDSIPSIIHSIPKVPIFVHQLEQVEVIRHYKTLLAIWKHLAMNTDRVDLRSDLIDVWFSILRSCSHQLESGMHVISAAELLMFTTTVIVEFLPETAMTDFKQHDWGSWDVRDQLRRLTLVDRLWSTMQEVFVDFDLTNAAAHILQSILKYAFHVLDNGVQKLWSRLCANLMTTTSRSFLRKIKDLPEPYLVIRSERELWGVVAVSLSSSDPGLSWKGIIKFLAIPICGWVLSKPELAAWEALLRDAITICGDPTLVTEHLVSRYFQGTDVKNWESVVVVLTLLLTCTHECRNIPTHNLLSVADACLTASYSQTCHSPEALTHSLELLDSIRGTLALAPNEVIRVLQPLSGSLSVWIEDHDEVMSDIQFNSVVVSLYREALEAFESLPLSTQFLQDMEGFLASAFCRIPTPAIAPFAFEKFWRATYYGRKQFYDILPPRIKYCLDCFVAAYGGDLADGLSSGTESQLQSISNDSQLFYFSSHPEPDQFGGRDTPVDDDACADMDVTPNGQQQTFMGQENAASLIISSDSLLPMILHQPQKYSSKAGAAPPDGWEQSTSDPSKPVLPVFPLHDAMPGPPVVDVIRKQKDNAPQKRSRSTRGTLRSLRKLDSEPSTRDITPIDIPRTGSVSPKKMVFDGVQVPTLREVLHRQSAQREETNVNMLRTGQDHMPISRLYLSRTTQRSMSEENSVNWEKYCVDATSSDDEVGIDQSLVAAGPSSSPLAHSHAHDFQSPEVVRFLPGLVYREQHRKVTFLRTSPALEEAKSTSARIDALRDVYSSVASGASQIPMSELLQAKRLVHRIGAVLTEQMGG